MNIGSFNLFEVGTKIDSSDIGNMNQFEPRSTIFYRACFSLFIDFFKVLSIKAA